MVAVKQDVLAMVAMVGLKRKWVFEAFDSTQTHGGLVKHR